MKVCCCCKKELDKSLFFKNKATKDGLLYHCKECHQKYYNLNKSRRLNQSKNWAENHNLRSRQISKKYRSSHDKTLNSRLSDILRNRILEMIRKNRSIKSQNTFNLLGCTIEELKQHLESQFQSGMTWNNRGLKGWHIDHIIPCSYFDLSDPEQQLICFNYRNLQPLWAKDNLRKGNKLNNY